MQSTKSFRLVALALVTLLVAGCEYHGLTCWNRLKILNSELTVMLYETGETDASALADVRSRMASNIEQCRGGDFYRELHADDILGGVYYSLFDFAVMANDVELVAAMHQTHLELSAEFRKEELALGDEYLSTAAFFESDDVVRWMLESGYDATGIDERGGMPLFYSGTRTEDGLRANRDLVAHGANVDYEAPNGNTPLLVAWRQGNLRKVQCLVSLGADIRVPLPEMEEPRDILIDPWDVAQVTLFLSNPDREIPDGIAGFCSIDE